MNASRSIHIIRPEGLTDAMASAIAGAPAGSVIQLDEDKHIVNMNLKAFWYLATPYTKYADGLEAAYDEACKAAAHLVAHGVHVFCPIAHTHGMARFVAKDKDNHDTWLRADRPFMDQAVGLLIYTMPGWDTSFGVKHEIDRFAMMGKPKNFLKWPFDPAAKPEFRSTP